MTPEGPIRIVMPGADPALLAWVRRLVPDAIVTAVPEALPALDADLVIVDLDAIGPGRWEGRAPGAGGDRPPVLGLTRALDVPGKLAATHMGVDDILALPCTPDAFLLRVSALAGRSLPHPAPAQSRGSLQLDLLHRRVRVRGEEVRLTGVEWSLLYILMEHTGEIVTRDEILDALWGVDFAPDSNVVERHIRSLRRKLHDDWHRPRYIETVHGKGYRLMLDGARVPRPPQTGTSPTNDT